VDRGIIQALQRNGRESFRRIAADLGVSEATVRARYGRLCDQSILQVTGVTNPLGLGFDASAMVGIRTTGPPEVVADELSHWEEADYVVVTTGRFDLLVEVVCADRRGLLDVTNRIRSLPQVVSPRRSSTSSSGSSSTTGAPGRTGPRRRPGERYRDAGGRAPR